MNVEYHGFTEYYLMFAIASIVSTSLWFGIIAITRSERLEVILKGKFQIIGVLSWAVAAAADGFLPLSIITLLIIRIILIISIFLLYIGWILPEPVKKILIKNK